MQSMASSSSHKTFNRKNYQPYPLEALIEPEEEEEVEEEEEDWLDLGLGISSSNSCTIATKTCAKKQATTVLVPAGGGAASARPSSSLNLNLQPPSQKEMMMMMGQGLKLGLEIGVEGGGAISIKEIDMEPPSSNYHTRFWEDQGHDCNYYYYKDTMLSTSFNGSFLGGGGGGVVLEQNYYHDWQMPVIPNHGEHNYYCGPAAASAVVAAAGAANTPTTNFRPHSTSSSSGLWFTLRSSANRDGEALPQIPKAYIRVKDENMTISLVKKYLVRKLGLPNEAEIEIRCMGQSLLHSQTLKQVRDSVWLPGLIESLNSTISSPSFTNSCNNGSVNHLMTLQYARRCIFN